MISDAALYLLRHGTAAGKSDANTAEEDFVRPLTSKGVRQSVNAGKLLRSIAPNIAACYCSPALRTRQTAELACNELGITPQAKRSLLTLKPAEAEALAVEGGAILLVGHGPGWSDDIVKALTGRTVAMRKGAIAGIQITNGQGQLRQLLGPKDVAGMVRTLSKADAREIVRTLDRHGAAVELAARAPTTGANGRPRHATTRWLSRDRRRRRGS